MNLYFFSVLKSRNNKPYYGGYSSLGYGGAPPSPSIPHNYFGGLGQPGYGFQPNQYHYHSGYTPGYHSPQLGQNYWNQPQTNNPNRPYYPPPPGATQHHQQSAYNPYNPTGQQNQFQNQPNYNQNQHGNTQYGKQPAYNPNYPQQPGTNPNYPANTGNTQHNPSAPPKDHSTHVSSGVPGGFNNSRPGGGGFNTTRNNQQHNQQHNQQNNFQCSGCSNGRCIGQNNCVCNGGFVFLFINKL